MAKGAALMGLGLGCDKPPENTQCPIYIGVVLATHFKDYDHEASQRYTDSFDGIDRAKDSIKWVVQRGDLVTEAAGIQRTLKIIKKMTPTGNQRGSVIVVTSEYDGPKRPQGNFNLSDGMSSSQVGRNPFR